MKPRVLVAGLFHETHTFLRERTGLDAFEKRGGAAMLACAGDASPLGGALETAGSLGWELVAGVDWRATPSGTVEREVFERFWGELAMHLGDGFDGIYLVLHGAMVCEGMRDVEGELLERLRQRVGMVMPIFGVFDLHANFSERMTLLANGLVGYRENPHTDARDAAVRGVRLMDASMRERRRLTMARCRVPVIWPPSGTGTAQDPMRTLEALARAAEAEGQVEAVSICAGYAYADTPDTGVAVVVVAGDEAEAKAVAEGIGRVAFEMRASGLAADLPKEEVRRLVERHCEMGTGVMVVAEQADNIGGGAPGDGTGLLRWFLEWGIQGALVAINDPESVEVVGAARAGTVVELRVGGRGSELGGTSVDGDFEVVRTGEGLFQLEDPNSHLASMSGNFFDMGRCAVVRQGGVTILLTSRKTPPFDLGQWRSQGVEPSAFRVIGVKAAVAHRRAYDPIATAQIWADVPGPCSGNLKGLPYREVSRPVYPLDDATMFSKL
jgi:microcystin degradation protein MlrC